jgi:pimeloyl-ACP methyl ester carboxylesterase
MDTDGFVHANGLRFGYRERGDPDDRLALCLHGFPDDAGTFDALAERLVPAGYRVVAPYSRGYGPTDEAPDGDYSVGALGADAVALAGALTDAAGDTDAAGPVLVGHDWGAAACYAALATAPDAFEAHAALALPPGFDRLLREHPRQWLRSWYMFVFQSPGAERLVRAGEFALVEFLWRTWSPGFEPPEERLCSVRETFRSEGTVAAALAYYRQAVPSFLAGGGDAPDDGTDADPAGLPGEALVLAGADDGCVGVDLFADVGGAFAGDARVAAVRDAGHFLHLERPDAVAAELLDWFGRGG